jgi:hypothetical protein
MIPILYDGWLLSHSPNSPGALHLLTLLEACPGDFEPIVALPTAPPEWLPEGISTRVEKVENTASGRLIWEQCRLPGLARQVDAKLIHLISRSVALFAPIKSLVSPTGFGGAGDKVLASGSNQQVWLPGRSEGMVERLRRSLTQGTQERILSLLWPKDLPYYERKVEPVHLRRMPPVVHPAFMKDQQQPAIGLPYDLPETYLLYQGPYNLQSIQNLLQAWSWAAGPLGKSCPLTLVGVDRDVLKPLEAVLTRSGLDDTLKVLPAISPGELAVLYRGCVGLFHPGPLSVWEGPLRLALSCGRAIIAARSPQVEALVGPAAYLVPETDFRGMGAALITVVVEEDVRNSLSVAARKRSEMWDLELFRGELARAYQELADRI